MLFFTFNCGFVFNLNLFKDFSQYFQDIFLLRGTKRAVMMLFSTFLVTTVANTFFLFCGLVILWVLINICLCVVGLNIFLGSLHFKPLHGLELISLSTIPGNTLATSVAMTTFFLFLGLVYKYFYFIDSGQVVLHYLNLMA